MVSNKQKKNQIINWMKFLEKCRVVFETEGKSIEVQKKVENMTYRGYSPEVESEELDNTGGDWIRLCYEDCYLFLYEDGSAEYQYDPNHLYGAEVVRCSTYEDFKECLNELENVVQYYQ